MQRSGGATKHLSLSPLGRAKGKAKATSSPAAVCEIANEALKFERPTDGEIARIKGMANVIIHTQVEGVGALSIGSVHRILDNEMLDDGGLDVYGCSLAQEITDIAYCTCFFVPLLRKAIENKDDLTKPSYFSAVCCRIGFGFLLIPLSELCAQTILQKHWSSDHLDKRVIFVPAKVGMHFFLVAVFPQITKICVVNSLTTTANDKEVVKVSP